MEFTHLKTTPIFDSLSDMGKEIFQPNGIFYWAGRAKKESDLSGTVGTAMGLESEFIEGGRDKFVPFYLPEIKNYFNIEPEKYVSYAPMAGVEELRQYWMDWIIYKAKTDSNLPSGNIDLTGKISKPIMCNGITNAIFLMSKLFLNPGEIIISPEKRWGNYNSILTRQNSIKIESFKFFKDGTYNTEGMLEVMEKIGEKQGKVVIILNFPNNPTGYCPTPEEVKGIVNCFKSYVESKNGKIPIIVLCDDAYEGYVFTDERVKQSIFNELVGIHPSVIPIKLDGSSKEMLMYGARVAGITLGLHPDWYGGEDSKKSDLLNEWDNKVKALIRSTISNINHFSQELLLKILSNGFEKLIQERKPVMDILKSRFEKTMSVYSELKTPNITMDPAGGGFFVFLNLSGVAADEFADILLKKYKLGTIPIVNKAEGINGLRVAYCSIPVDKIEDCFKRIDTAIRDIA